MLENTALAKMFSPPPAVEKSRHPVFDTALEIVRAGVPLMLVGPSGSGKSEMVIQLAEALKLEFAYVATVEASFEFVGFTTANGDPATTLFIDAFENGKLFSIEEMDSCDPKSLLVISTAISNGVLSAGGRLIQKHPNFRLVASANTWGNGATLEYVGSARLDKRTTNRFFKQFVDYDAELERRIVHDLYQGRHDDWVKTVQTARAEAGVLQLHHIISMRASFEGAKLLEAGIPQDIVFEGYIFDDLPKDDRIKLAKKMEESFSSLKDVMDKATKQNQSVTGILTEVSSTLNRFVELQQSQNTIVELSERAKAVVKDIKVIADSIAAAEGTAKAAKNLRGQLEAVQQQALQVIQKYGTPKL